MFIRSRDIEEKAKEYEGDEKYMACIRTVEELSTDPEFAGYYDLEEAHRQDLRDSYLEGVEDANIETAKKMLEENLDIEFIMKCTNLSIEKIEKLKED